MAQQERIPYRSLRAMSAEDVITAVFAQMNGPCYTFEEALCKHWKSEHLTLQLAFLRHVVRPVLEQMAITRTDERNEASKRWAIAVLAGIGDIHLPLI